MFLAGSGFRDGKGFNSLVVPFADLGVVEGSSGGQTGDNLLVIFSEERKVYLTGQPLAAGFNSHW
jgi:hypothetical protein